MGELIDRPRNWAEIGARKSLGFCIALYLSNPWYKLILSFYCEKTYIGLVFIMLFSPKLDVAFFLNIR